MAPSGAAPDARFDVPLYSQAEAARYVDMPASTLRTWAQGYERRGHGRSRTRRAQPAATSVVRGSPIITYVPPLHPSDPSVPFIGLAEAMFLSALRKAGVPLQQIRPALSLVQERLDVTHALASRRLYAVGAQLLWEVAEEGELDRGSRRALIVLRDGQYVFREVIEQYLRRIEYADDGYAERVTLPGYKWREWSPILRSTLVNHSSRSRPADQVQPPRTSGSLPVRSALLHISSGRSQRRRGD
ncbi:hypothetical protein ACFP2T_22250 [Plantactinospora solaniradicis]|uniref:Putative antitoxin VapB45-like DNA-binding HTH domain-containing protein n=1 Tax=Plantactinospora solaniradicis TaxID=1723736 RepID=A0ABW1KCC9_9ACTN